MRILPALLLLASTAVSAQAASTLPVLRSTPGVTSPGAGVLVDRIVATVDSRAITRSELDARAERSKTARDAALDEMIDEYLIAKDAIAKAITISDDDVDKAIQMVMDQNKITKDEFEKALVAQSYTLDEYRTAIGLQLLELRWLSIRSASVDKPTDEAGRAKFFADQKKRFVTELRAKAAIEVRP